MSVAFRVLGDGADIELDDFDAIVAGYTGRDAAAVQHHIDELAAIGVAPPPRVPMFYAMDPGTVSSAAEHLGSGHLTSGEVEPVYVRHGGVYFLGVGSDHTDRDLERVDIGDSKRACPKPVGARLIRIGTRAEFDALDLDSAIARCTVDDVVYQEGALAGLRRPGDIAGRLIEHLGLPEERDFVCFGGTLPLLDGEFVAGEHWRIELELPDGRELTHEYRVKGPSE